MRDQITITNTGDKNIVNTGNYAVGDNNILSSQISRSIIGNHNNVINYIVMPDLSSDAIYRDILLKLNLAEARLFQMMQFINDKGLLNEYQLKTNI